MAEDKLLGSPTETPSLGYGIGLQAKTKYYVPEIMTAMQKSDAAVMDLIKLQAEQNRQRRKDLETYSDKLNDFQVTDNNNLWIGYQKDMKIRWAKIIDKMETKSAKNEYYNPKADPELQKKIIDTRLLSGAYETATKLMMSDVMNSKNTNLYTIDTDIENAINSGDMGNLTNTYLKIAQKYDDENNTNTVTLTPQDGIYTGGLLETKDKPSDFNIYLKKMALGPDTIKGIDKDGKEIITTKNRTEQDYLNSWGGIQQTPIYTSAISDLMLKINPSTGERYTENEANKFWYEIYKNMTPTTVSTLPIEKGGGEFGGGGINVGKYTFAIGKPGISVIKSPDEITKSLGKTLIIGKGGSPLPILNFTDRSGVVYIGRLDDIVNAPTILSAGGTATEADIEKADKNPEFWAEVLVPEKKLSTAKILAMTEEEFDAYMTKEELNFTLLRYFYLGKRGDEMSVNMKKVTTALGVESLFKIYDALIEQKSPSLTPPPTSQKTVKYSFFSYYGTDSKKLDVPKETILNVLKEEEDEFLKANPDAKKVK